MRIKELLEEELKAEKKALKEVRLKSRKNPPWVLVMSRSRKGRECFYYRERTGSTKTYIRTSDEGTLRKIAYGRFLKEKQKILSENINAIEAILESIRDYDNDSVREDLPAEYRKAIERLDGKVTMEKVIQSEDPKHPEGLKVICSNGLRVRSKNEMAIVELLLQYKVKFRYEMALELSVISESNGIAVMETKTIYPDFTIFLPDGTVVYWEHFGMLDKDDYRDSFIYKMLLYYDNGIYAPKNLIITMDGPNNAFDGLGIRRIIEERLLY